MCRLFGFRSNLVSQVHSSLVSAENALMHQSIHHPDGWGVAYYVEGSPQVIKSLSTAIDDHVFRTVSGVVSSQTVIAHLRKKTIGECSVLNTHPFQYGKWVFAHNGNIRNFLVHREALLDLVDMKYRPYILGCTDSELFFYLILSALSSIVKASQKNESSIGRDDQAGISYSKVSIQCLKKACLIAVGQVVNVVGPMLDNDDGHSSETFLTFLITNGDILLGHQGGKSLYYSTHKKKCIDRLTCSEFSSRCETQVVGGVVSHLLFSSEPTEGNSIWIPMKFGQMIAVGKDMYLDPIS